MKKYLLIQFVLDEAKPYPFIPFPARLEQGITFNFQGSNNWITVQTQVRQTAPLRAIFGQHTTRFNLHSSSSYQLLHVFFQPGARYRLLGVPLIEVTDTWIDAESAVDNEVMGVNEQLANAPDNTKMIRLVESYF